MRGPWTYAAFLLSFAASVSHTATAQQSFPTPESVLGFAIGADFHLASYDQSIAYFQRLAASSDRMQLVEIGRTSGNLPWYIALISSPANLANIERYRDIAQQLAHPENLDDNAARALANEGKAIVHIDGGLHATEVAHAQHNIQLAYDLVTSNDDPEIASILENVVLILWPSINPDGQNMVAAWYESNVGTSFEVSPIPFLYQKYIGHDNNRDGYMINMIESRVTTRVVREWEPQILYNHHQSSPFPTRIWIPPFAEPISEYVHPLMWRTVNLMGMAMAQALEERGQKGAVHMGTGFDNWYPDLRPQSLYSSPWEGGWWRLRDAVDYMLTASISVLDVASKYKTDILYNRYQAGRDVIQQYTDNPPYAYFVRQQQRDPMAAVELLRRLAYNGIEIHELNNAVSFQGQTFASGTWVIPMDQPFANFVRQLFAIQDYPDIREFPDGPPDQPYDVAGWTLPLQMGVDVIEAAQPLPPSIRVAMELVQGVPMEWNAEVGDATPFDTPRGVGFNTNAIAAGILPAPGVIEGGGSALVVDPAQNNAFRAINAAWQQGATVRFAAGQPATEDGAATSGSYQISGLSGTAATTLVSDLALQSFRSRANGSAMPKPRIGLYRPWRASIDEGWTRWLLESYGFDYVSVYNADIISGDLDDRYDVIIIADIGGETIMNGFAKGTVPPRYAGGIGRLGVRALDEFVRAGGTLVTLNSSSEFAIEQLHLPVENMVDGVEREEFFLSGSIVEMIVDPSHPVMSGMPERANVFVGRSPVFSTTEGFEGSILAKYSASGSPLLSGYLLGPEHLQGYASAVDVEHGDGRVLLLGMRPQWRGQPFGNFRILFNAALYTSDVAAVRAPNPEFWTKPDTEESEESKEPTTGR